MDMAAVARRWHPGRIALQLLALLLGWMMMVLVLATALVLLSEDAPDLASIADILLQFPPEDEFASILLIPAAIIILIQFLLVLPLARPLRKNGTPRSPWYAAVAVGLLWALLVGGLVTLAAELPRLPLALEIVAPGEGYDPAEEADRTVDGLVPWLYPVVLVMMLLTWITWTIVLLAAIRTGSQNWLGRSVRWLIAGSGIELALALPLYLLVRRRFDCWCALPSLWSTCLALVSMLALTGPGFVLLHRRRKGAAAGNWVDRCLLCGYRRRPGVGACCPECGIRWGRFTTEDATRASGDPDGT